MLIIMIRKKNDIHAYGNAESDNDKRQKAIIINARREKKGKKKTEKKATIPLIQQLAWIRSQFVW